MNNLSLVTDDVENAPFVLEMENRIRDIAMTNLNGAMSSRKYTGPELYAMQVFGMLEAMNSYDLAGIVLRGKLIRQVEDRELWHIIPGNYSSASEAIRSAGKMSPTQQSFVTGMRDVVFPYVKDHLGMSIVEFWDQVGESQAREILPILKRLITDKVSRSEQVNENAQKLLEDFGDDKEDAVAHLIDLAGGSTVRELRKSLGGVIPYNVWMLRTNEGAYMIGFLNNDQIEKFNRLNGDHADITDLSWTDENLRSHPVRALLAAFGGNNVQAKL